MNKSLLVILILLLSVNCKSSDLTIRKKTFSSNENISYWDPVYIYKASSYSQKTYNGFEKTTRFTLDSLFAKEAEKYNISEKLSLQKKNDDLEKDIIAIFKSEYKDKANFQLPVRLASYFKNSSERYLMLLAFTPKTGMIAGSFPYIKNSTLQIIIVDLRENNIVYYDKSSSGTTLNKGYRRNLIQDLDNIYFNLKRD